MASAKGGLAMQLSLVDGGGGQVRCDLGQGILAFREISVSGLAGYLPHDVGPVA